MNDLEEKQHIEIEVDDAADGDSVVLDLDDEADPETVAAEALRAIEEAENAPPRPSADPPAPSGDVGGLQQEVADLKEQHLRTMADFENFRKRSERERRDLQRYALLDPMRDLLAVIDNLERAMAVEGGSIEDLKAGVEMTLTQFRELVGRHGIQVVEAVGQPFDPSLHDAVSRFEDGEVELPTVAEEYQKGYTIHERLLRPSMVRVAMPVEGKKPPAGDADS